VLRQQIFRVPTGAVIVLFSMFESKIAGKARKIKSNSPFRTQPEEFKGAADL
jgi:hypothetical protein